ncbi:MAG: 4-hydroxy-tetrahydrodipicolinate reductase [Alphaproteobacteria bacterium 33-17]|nr:MAG: 4-hydroxy-tetrahydrodipicolinate reductase [Alphaproteobacteria bacterium 33-17]
MIKVCIIGAAGRLGSILTDAIRETQDLVISYLIVDEQSKSLGQKNQNLTYTHYIENPDEVDIIIDFSTRESALLHLQTAIKYNKPYVIGTTGFSDIELNIIKSAAKEIPIMHSHNFSYGIAVLKKVLEVTCKALDESFDIEILETHHRNKLDSPSGTAINLFNTIKHNNPRYYPVTDERYQGEKRKMREVGIMSQRGGNICGEHEIRFISDHEEIYLGHKAFDRKIFALGAIKAARWLIGKPGGLYEFEEIL